MISTTRRRHGLRVSFGLGLMVALLTGCTGLNPGVAVSVGDDEITTGEVDELAADVCAVEEATPNTADQPSAVAGSAVRDAALQALVLRSVADQLGEEYGVAAGESYLTTVDQTKLQFGSVDQGLVEDALPAYTASAYFVDIMRAIGQQESGADTTPDEALTAGIAVAQEWQDEHGIETNPAYGSFRIGDTGIESERGDLSVAVGDRAKEAEEGSAEWVASLPSSQRCG